eukprot:776252_1
MSGSQPTSVNVAKEVTSLDSEVQPDTEYPGFFPDEPIEESPEAISGDSGDTDGDSKTNAVEQQTRKPVVLTVSEAEQIRESVIELLLVSVVETEPVTVRPSTGPFITLIPGDAPLIDSHVAFYVEKCTSVFGKMGKSHVRSLIAAIFKNATFMKKKIYNCATVRSYLPDSVKLPQGDRQITVFVRLLDRGETAEAEAIEAFRKRINQLNYRGDVIITEAAVAARKIFRAELQNVRDAHLGKATSMTPSKPIEDDAPETIDEPEHPAVMIIREPKKRKAFLTPAQNSKKRKAVLDDALRQQPAMGSASPTVTTPLENLNFSANTSQQQPLFSELENLRYKVQMLARENAELRAHARVAVRGLAAVSGLTVTENFLAA